MSLSETKSLLRIHRIFPNKLLGQNFMIDASLFPKLANYSSLRDDDAVLDVGAGFGFLTRFLSNKCKTVIAVEKDPQIAEVLHEQIKDLANITIIIGDVLRIDLPDFNKIVSIPPYYISSHLITWLLDQRLDCAVLVLQKEFADRLVAIQGTEEYGWLNAVTYQRAKVELLDDVPKWMFYPEPEVDSVVVRLKLWTTPPFNVKNPTFYKQLVRWLFTQRNKKLENALVPFIRTERKIDKTESAKIAHSLPLGEKRVRDLSPQEFGAIADALTQ